MTVSGPRGISRSALAIVATLVAAAVAIAFVLRGDSTTEVERLCALLRIEPGDTVAEIGAGNGWLSVAVAERVTSDGRVLATELSADRRDDIRDAVAGAGLDNVTVVEAGVQSTNLDAGCCDALFMRRVYHHLSDPRAINSSLYAALRPGGRLAIIDFRSDGWFARIIGEGILPEALVAQVTSAGFTHLATDDWPGAGHYVALFQKSP